MIIRKCLVCKKTFYTYPSRIRNKFCSMSCSVKYRWKIGEITGPMKGKVAWNKGIPGLQGEKSSSWKGEKAGYDAKHWWIRHKLGTPNKCERCGSTTATRYEWANISRNYSRDLDDWERLCVSCHRKEGYKRGEYVPWNKGTIGLMPTPWNKGLRTI